MVARTRVLGVGEKWVYWRFILEIEFPRQSTSFEVRMKEREESSVTPWEDWGGRYRGERRTPIWGLWRLSC